ncbi:hypothetical protein BLAT2472_20707 [Burkholderia latens]
MRYGAGFRAVACFSLYPCRTLVTTSVIATILRTLPGGASERDSRSRPTHARRPYRTRHGRRPRPRRGHLRGTGATRRARDRRRSRRRSRGGRRAAARAARRPGGRTAARRARRGVGAAGRARRARGARRSRHRRQ